MKIVPSHALCALVLSSASWAALAQGAAAADAHRARSPAVQAAEAARLPGELRPERPAVEQVAVELPRRAPSASDERRAAPSDDVMDQAARCVALEDKARRQSCIARLEALHAEQDAD